MTEIQKMQRYIKRTPMKGADNYCLVYSEAVELLNRAIGTNSMFEVITLAFDYGKAKGYRAAKAQKGG